MTINLGDGNEGDKVTNLATFRERLTREQLEQKARNFLAPFLDFANARESFYTSLDTLEESVRRALPLAVANPATAERALKNAPTIVNGILSCREMLDSKHMTKRAIDQWGLMYHRLDEISFALLEIIFSPEELSSSGISDANDIASNITVLKEHIAHVKASKELADAFDAAVSQMLSIETHRKLLEGSVNRIWGLAITGVNDMILEKDISSIPGSAATMAKIGDDLAAGENALKSTDAKLGSLNDRLNRADQYLAAAAMEYLKLYKDSLNIKKSPES